MIENSELEDFSAILRKADYVESDFELSETSDPFPTMGVGPITGTVTVKKNGVTRSYPSGHGTAWVVAFERDLLAGIFDYRR